jgi:hypothetical protein
LLARLLGHDLHLNDKGADGIDPVSELRYEYKVSQDDQFNFNFGHAGERGDAAADLVDRHFGGLAGAYCALMDGITFVRVVYCPATTLVPHLRAHLATVKGMTYQKNFGAIANFAKLDQTTEIPL